MASLNRSGSRRGFALEDRRSQSPTGGLKRGMGVGLGDARIGVSGHLALDAPHKVELA
jgi:hypothetical protein